MTEAGIQHLLRHRLYPGAQEGQLVETHISWLILTPDHVFKFKKPLRFDFLDFSTLDLRRHYCAEELRLNRRLAPDIYLEVLPVGADGIGSDTPEVMDYAVHMRRMDNRREMDALLRQGAVTPQHIEELATLLAGFHLQHRLSGPDAAFNLSETIADFADLFHYQSDAELLLPGSAALFECLSTAVPAFLTRHAARLEARAREGFWVEGHGDLHTRNIFLPENTPPVVFDCLEFNTHFRRMDVLNELAFLCMDLEYYGRPDLAAHFMQHYTAIWPCLETPEDEQIFHYFKTYRANVRLKVALIQQRQHPGLNREEEVKRYGKLLEQFKQPM